MLRGMPLVNSWRPGTRYTPGTVVAFQSVDYRVLVAHTANQPPTARFDLWERVNNNDGSWAPQIRYAVDDRVTFNGGLYAARAVHQARTGLEPSSAPTLWRQLPLTACGQLTEFCAANTGATGTSCVATGQAGDETACLGQLSSCLFACQPEVQHSPCSGLCANPIAFTVPDGTTFSSGAVGSGAACYETLSQLDSGTCSGLGNRTVTVNGVAETCNGRGWSSPLPVQRNEGYCIQATAGNPAGASFTAQ
jgi:hypothetical protein